MANVKISALPTYTGDTSDPRWFVMNDSGNTETFKYSGYTSGVRPVSGFTGSFITLNYTDSNIASPYSLLLGGENNSIAASYFVGRNTIIGGDNNSIPAGFGNMILNASSASISANQSIIAGGSGTITDGFSNGIFGGNGTVGSNYCAIVGGLSNTIGQYVTDFCFIGGGQSNQLLNAPWGGIISGKNNRLDGASAYSVIAGGENNLIDSSYYSQILGGLNNTINCEIPNTERFNTIIGGSGNTIFDTADDQKLQTIINSVDTTLQNGVERVTAIGLSGRTINDAQAGVTYVETLKAFKMLASGFYDNGSIPQAGYTIDLNNGDKQQITITGSAGNTALYFTGNIAGSRLVLKVINTSTGDLGFADTSPYRWKIPAVYPSASPSATDVYIFESFGDQELWFASQSKNLS